MYQKGKVAELNASKQIHQRYLPILVSSVILRKRHCGQIDLACLNNKILTLFEIKKRSLGKQQITSTQKMRLIRSANFLGRLLNRKIELRVWDF